MLDHDIHDGCIVHEYPLAWNPGAVLFKVVLVFFILGILTGHHRIVSDLSVCIDHVAMLFPSMMPVFVFFTQVIQMTTVWAGDVSVTIAIAPRPRPCITALHLARVGVHGEFASSPPQRIISVRAAMYVGLPPTMTIACSIACRPPCGWNVLPTAISVKPRLNSRDMLDLPQEVCKDVLRCDLDVGIRVGQVFPKMDVSDPARGQCLHGVSLTRVRPRTRADS